jgi:hypothetical protein
MEHTIMSRRPESEPGLPVFEYQPATTAQAQPEIAPRQAESEPQIVFSPEAWSAFGERAVAHVANQDRRRHEANQAFLGLYGPAPTQNARAIGAAPHAGNRLEIEGPRRTKPSNGSSKPGQPPRGAGSTPLPSPISETQEKKSLWTLITEHKVGTAGVVAAMAGLAIVGANASGAENKGDTAAALQAQALSKELRTDTFIDGTPLAIAKIATGQNVEARIPVQLKEAGHDAYISINVKQMKLPVKIEAKGVVDTKKGSTAVWARLNKDKDGYVVDRSALTLSTKPWLEALVETKDGTISTQQVLTNVANTILPPASPYQNLIVDGKPADWSKYPAASQPSIIWKDVSNPKEPKYVYDSKFVTELIDEMQLKTLQALETPNLCSKVLPAIDTASMATVREQNSLPKDMVITVNQKTAYGKASEAFAADPNVTKALGQKLLSIEQFTLSCPTDPVLPVAATGTSSPTVTPSTKPKTSATTKK